MGVFDGTALGIQYPVVWVQGGQLWAVGETANHMYCLDPESGKPIQVERADIVLILGDIIRQTGVELSVGSRQEVSVNTARIKFKMIIAE